MVTFLGGLALLHGKVAILSCHFLTLTLNGGQSLIGAGLASESYDYLALTLPLYGTSPFENVIQNSKLSTRHLGITMSPRFLYVIYITQAWAKAHLVKMYLE